MLGTKQYPSQIGNEIYKLMEQERFIKGIDVYSAGLESAVLTHMENRGVEFQLGSTVRQDYDGESVYLSWIEDGHIHMISWEVKY